MKRYFLLLFLLVQSPFSSGWVNPNPHPDPDRPRIYTANYHWQAQPELARKLMRGNNLRTPPQVEKLTGCMSALDYLVTPAEEEATVKLDLSVLGPLERGELITVARGPLDITGFPQPPLPAEGLMRSGRTAIEKRIPPGKKPFRIQAAAPIQDEGFSFYNASSRELLAFPVQEKVRSLQLSFHPEDAVFDWRVLERFPNVNWLELEGVTAFRNSAEFRRSLSQLTLRGCRNIELPRCKPAFGLTLECCDFRPEQLENLDVSEIGIVEISGSQLADLAFLKRFAECRVLTLLHWPNLKEITPLAELKQLRSVKISDTAVADISPLANLKGLSMLSLDDNRIKDLSPLAGREFTIFSFSGTNPVADRALGKEFSGNTSRCQVIYPRKIEWNGHHWQLTITGTRTGDTFLPESGALSRADRAVHDHFQLDPRSGHRDYPPPGQVRHVHLPRPEGEQYSIVIAGTQRFSDFIRADAHGVKIICREGELHGIFQ